MPRKRRKKSDFADEILRGMARGPWSLAWDAGQQELGRRSPGDDIYNSAPEAPLWAAEWAERLALAVTELNQAPLEAIYQAALSAGFRQDREVFGSYLGLQATGTGVRWDDNLRRSDLRIKVPSSEFYEGAEPDLRFVSQ